MKTASKHQKKPYDLALSFAGADRAFVAEVAANLQFLNVKVFYDTWEQHRLLGADLYTYLADIYQHKAKYAVLFLSRAYIKSAWPRHELRSAQPYIIPIRMDNTPCPGIPETIGHIDGKKTSPSSIALLLLRRLGGNLKRGRVNEYVVEKDVTYDIAWNGDVRVNTQYSVIWLGMSPIDRFHPSIWSPVGSELRLRSFVARDSKGALKATLTSRTESSQAYTVHYRAPLSYGDSLKFQVRYECAAYFRDVTELCVDNSRVGLPTHHLKRRFIFPRNSRLTEFELTRRYRRSTVSQIYATSIERSCPVVSYAYDYPEVGSVYEVRFRLARDVRRGQTAPPEGHPQPSHS